MRIDQIVSDLAADSDVASFRIWHVQGFMMTVEADLLCGGKRFDAYSHIEEGRYRVFNADRLTSEDRKVIARRLADSKMTQAHIAEVIGISQPYVYKILKAKS